MKIYYCNINEFLDLCGTEYLSSNRLERIERYRTLSAKAACLVSGLLLRMTLGADYEERLTTNSHGKPLLKDNSCFFNISHSGDYVILAISDCELGADIEKITFHNPKVAERCLTANEKEWLKQHPCDKSFYQLWTGKEAVMKATGEGFSMDTRNFHLLPIQDGIHKIRDKHWFFQWFELDGYQVCIVSAEKKTKELIPLSKRTLFHILEHEIFSDENDM